MDMFAEILADAVRSKAQAEKLLVEVCAGAKLSLGISRDKAEEILFANIADYDAIIGRYGWRDNA